jgi:hypothetical protein
MEVPQNTERAKKSIGASIAEFRRVSWRANVRELNPVHIQNLVEAVKNLPETLVHDLDLGNCRLPDRHVAKLTKCFLKKLTPTTSVNLHGNDIGTSTMKILCSSQLRFRRLSISCNKTTPAAFDILINALKESSCQLQELKLVGTLLPKRNFAAMIASALKENQSLNVLDLSECALGEDGIKELDKTCFCNLKDFSLGAHCEGLSRSVLSDLLEALLDSKTLQQCRFDGIGNNSAVLLSTFIGKSKLKQLRLTYPNLDHNGIKCIFQGISNCAEFQSLTLFKAYNSQKYTVSDLCAIISSHPSLVQVELGYYQNNQVIKRCIEISQHPTSKALSALCSIRLIPRIGRMATIKDLPNDCYVRLKAFLISI